MTPTSARPAARRRAPRGRAHNTLAASRLTHLYPRQGERIVPIPIATIVRIQQGDYAEVHAATGERVHRSHVVNLDAVLDLRANEDRRLRITLKDGSCVVASRVASEELRKPAK